MRRRGLVAGAAIAGSRNAADQQAAYDQGVADAQASAPPPPPPPAPAAPAQDPMDAKIAELEKLGKLRDAGVLTEEEFEAQKAQILAS
ncbi:MAG: SHOCT domain-containing protein [Chloroflexota bacterium]|jgi:hypothetical protein